MNPDPGQPIEDPDTQKWIFGCTLALCRAGHELCYTWICANYWAPQRTVRPVAEQEQESPDADQASEEHSHLIVINSIFGSLKPVFWNRIDLGTEAQCRSRSGSIRTLVNAIYGIHLPDSVCVK
jgi:hypothetical protein